jgi:hypothetical protein
MQETLTYYQLTEICKFEDVFNSAITQLIQYATTQKQYTTHELDELQKDLAKQNIIINKAFYELLIAGLGLESWNINFDISDKTINTQFDENGDLQTHEDLDQVVGFSFADRTTNSHLPLHLVLNLIDTYFHTYFLTGEDLELVVVGNGNAQEIEGDFRSQIISSLVFYFELSLVCSHQKDGEPIVQLELESYGINAVYDTSLLINKSVFYDSISFTTLADLTPEQTHEIFDSILKQLLINIAGFIRETNLVFENAEIIGKTGNTDEIAAKIEREKIEIESREKTGS